MVTPVPVRLPWPLKVECPGEDIRSSAHVDREAGANRRRPAVADNSVGIWLPLDNLRRRSSGGVMGAAEQVPARRGVRRGDQRCKRITDRCDFDRCRAAIAGLTRGPTHDPNASRGQRTARASEDQCIRVIGVIHYLTAGSIHIERALEVDGVCRGRVQRVNTSVSKFAPLNATARADHRHRCETEQSHEKRWLRLPDDGFYIARGAGMRAVKGPDGLTAHGMPFDTIREAVLCRSGLSGGLDLGYASPQDSDLFRSRDGRSVRGDLQVSLGVEEDADISCEPTKPRMQVKHSATRIRVWPLSSLIRFISESSLPFRSLTTTSARAQSASGQLQIESNTLHCSLNRGPNGGSGGSKEQPIRSEARKARSAFTSSTSRPSAM